MKKYNTEKAIAVFDLMHEIKRELDDNNATNFRATLVDEASWDTIRAIERLIKLARNKRETIRRAFSEVN